MSWWQILVSCVLVFFGHAVAMRAQEPMLDAAFDDQLGQAFDLAVECRLRDEVARIEQDVDRRVADYYAQDSAGWRATHRYGLETIEDLRRMIPQHYF